MMAGKTLPYDAEIEYIESTGTQYIDTGVPATYELTELETQVLFKQGNTIGRFLAASYLLSGKNPRCYLLEKNSSASIRVTNQTDSSFSNAKALSATGHFDNNYYLIKSSIDSTGMSLQGNTLANTVDGADGTKNYYLFCLNGTTASSFVKCQCKYCIIKKNNVIVRYFIPVRVGTVGYMYDRVSGQLFGNAGTGAFILGPDVQ